MRTNAWSATVSNSASMSSAGTSQRRCRKCSAFSRSASVSASRSTTPSRKVRIRSLSKPRSPRHSASNTVVTPAPTHCASCATMAERDGQRAKVRGCTCRSRLSVCKSTMPGTSNRRPYRVPRAAWNDRLARLQCRRRARPECPQASRPAVPRWRWSGRCRYSCGVLQRGQRKQPVGDGVAHIRIVADGNDCRPARLGFVNQRNDDGAIFRVQRRGRFIE